MPDTIKTTPLAPDCVGNAPANYKATLVITTHNRKDDLLNAIASAVNQTAPLEIIVLDDASTDGTALAVREKFPQVRLFVSEDREGYIRLRNRGAYLARAPIIFSIDDDAIFATNRIVEQVLRDFEHPRVGAVAIPFIDVRVSEEVRQRAPASGEPYVSAHFIGTAHAIRRDVFFEVGQYREFFEHQCEEPDFCRRMLGHGYVVKLGSSDVIHHFYSPKRDLRRLHYYHTRNNILLTWCTVPWPAVLWRLSRSILGNSVLAAWGSDRLSRFRGLAAGVNGIWRFRGQRTPIPQPCYRLLRMLVERPRRLSEVAHLLPALPSTKGREYLAAASRMGTPPAPPTHDKTC
ncbi:MAG: glycosyltransferase family 2 protein [Phycisphaerales bacterium]|nr:glycosyltransferase family 2 protein [Phycisphaerales bacterium]